MITTSAAKAASVSRPVHCPRGTNDRRFTGQFTRATRQEPWLRGAMLVAAQIMLALVFWLSAGCGAEPSRHARRTVALSEVPENVMNAAKARLPDIEFADSWKNVDKDGNLHSYEIRGRNKDGKIRECRVSPTGEILEVE